MTTAMMTAPATPPASLSAFGSQLIKALTVAELMGPLVPSDGTNYATKQEQNWKPLTFQGKMGLEKPVVSTLWSGIGNLLPPNYRAWPMLLNMPGAVPPSSADIEAQEMMRAWHQSPPIGWIENLADSGRLEAGRPSFYNQLSFFRKVVELTQTKLENASTSTPSQKLVNEVELTLLAAKWLRSDEHAKTYYAIVSATKKASSAQPADLTKVADDLGNVSALYYKQGLIPLSAIAMEVATALYMSAARARGL